jgi:hypothetical protein
VGSHGSLSLLFMMKVMLITLRVLWPHLSGCFVFIVLQSFLCSFIDIWGCYCMWMLYSWQRSSDMKCISPLLQVCLQLPSWVFVRRGDQWSAPHDPHSWFHECCVWCTFKTREAVHSW